MAFVNPAAAPKSFGISVHRCTDGFQPRVRPFRSEFASFKMCLPKTFESLHAATIASMNAALSSKVPLIEIQFPPVANMATAALNQTLDANRSFARQLMRAFQGRIAPGSTHILFPDKGEATLARKVWGDVPFSVRSLPDKRPDYIERDAKRGGIIVVVNPGFNVDEWIKMQNLRGALPIVSVNADFDKLRGGYYPKIFYPGLHKAYDAFLNEFESVYYVKQFSNGGTLLRAYPEKWLLYYDSLNGEREVLWSGDDRPAFREVERMLRERRTKDLVAR